MSIDTYPPIDTTLILPLAISNGGTGADDAAEARSNLGLGTMSTQNANAVAITGGTAVGLSSVGIAMLPSFQLDVTGKARISDEVGIERLPIDGYSLSTLGPVLVGNRLGVNVLPDTYACAVAGMSYFSSEVGIGRTPQVGNKLSIDYQKGSATGLLMRTTDNDTGAFPAIALMNVAGAIVGSISTTASATAYNTSSDVRLKYAIEKLVGSLDIIRVLNPVSFFWNVNDEKGEGFLAHELQQRIPYAVTGKSDAINADGTINPQQVDYSKLVPRLVGAIQELLVRVEHLEMQLG